MSIDQITDISDLDGFYPVFFPDRTRMRALGRKRVKGEGSIRVEKNAKWQAFVRRWS